MNNKITKFLLPLAALTMVSVACDPFPEAPGGDPVIVRVITSGIDGDSNTVETVTGGTTVSTDLAWVNDHIWVQFNKPMDGTSIQSNAQYNADGSTVVDVNGDPIPCVKAAGVTLSATFDAATQVCYEPNSPTDGGYLRVMPGAPLVFGAVYTITGSVKDYEGKSLTLNVTVTVDQRPLPFARSADGYSLGLDWFDSGVATSYEVFRAPDVAGAPGTYASVAVIDPAVDCDGTWCGLYYDTMLVPDTAYWYEIRETVGATTTARPAVAGAVTTYHPLLPTFGVASTTTLPPTVIPGVIRVGWSAVADASGYEVEQSTDGTAWTLVSTQTALVFYAGAPAPGLVAPTTGPGTLTSGTRYYYRVTPTFAAPPVGYVPVKGRSASKVAP